MLLSPWCTIHIQFSIFFRYRRPLNFLMPFIVRTRLVYFDHRSLYFEQKFISKPDNFIRAVAFCKNTIVNCNVIDLMKSEYDMVQPECPPDLKKFIEANEISSNRLRMTGHPASEATSLMQMENVSKTD